MSRLPTIAARAVLVLLVCLLVAPHWGCSCARRGYRTGKAPTTMQIMIQGKAFGGGVFSTVVRADLVRELGIALTTNTIPPPAPAATPVVNASVPWKYAEVEVGGTKYYHRNYRGPNQFAVEDKSSQSSLFQWVGYLSPVNNGCVLYSSGGLQSWFGKSYTFSAPTGAVTLAGNSVSHCAAYTIIHELLWHRVSDYTFHDDSMPRHIGCNNWDLVVNGNPNGLGHYVLKGAFPIVRTQEMRDLQVRMGYLAR